MKKPKFKARYIVGTGYPVWTDGDEVNPKGIALYSYRYKYAKYLIVPDDLKDPRRPKYRLVLERIK